MIVMQNLLKRKKDLFDYILMLAVAVLIVVFAVLRQQSFIKTLPTLVTLVIQLLTVRANRYAFLIGSINALVYGISYYSEGLYFSLVSAVLISSPIQLYSFISWSKKAGGKNTPPLRFLGTKKLLFTVCGSLAAWAICVFGLSGLFESASYPAIDSYLFVMGIVVSFLAAWRYVDAQYLSIISCVLSLCLWILLTLRNPSNFNYVIISAYNLFRVLQAAINWTKKYRNEKIAEES